MKNTEPYDPVFFTEHASKAYSEKNQRFPKPTACLVSEPMMA